MNETIGHPSYKAMQFQLQYWPKKESGVNVNNMTNYVPLHFNFTPSRFILQKPEISAGTDEPSGSPNYDWGILYLTFYTLILYVAVSFLASGVTHLSWKTAFSVQRRECPSEKITWMKQLDNADRYSYLLNELLWSSSLSNKFYSRILSMQMADQADTAEVSPIFVEHLIRRNLLSLHKVVLHLSSTLF